MDKTLERLENYRAKEVQRDFEINMLQALWNDKMNLTWLEILTFGWMWCRKGCASRRVKEMFIEEVHEKFLEQLKI